MAVEVRLPQWGMGMTEGEIVEWLVAEGEKVAEGEPLVEVETAKATEVMDAPASGVLAKILAPVGEVVPVQGVLAVIEPEGA